MITACPISSPIRLYHSTRVTHSIFRPIPLLHVISQFSYGKLRKESNLESSLKDHIGERTGDRSETDTPEGVESVVGVTDDTEGACEGLVN